MAFDVTDATFETDVLERSMRVPVVVDLWAEWCGPCRTLGPVLEQVVAETAGAVELAKVDVDSNPRIAATFQVQSIPAVHAIAERKFVDSFVGAIPEQAVRQWVAALVRPPSEAELLVLEGDEESLRKALELEPANEAALVALVGMLLADSGGSGEDAEGSQRRQEALSLLARLPETSETRRLAAVARLAPTLGDGLGEQAVEARLDQLLGQVKDDQAAKQEYLDILEVLGADDPRTGRYRRALTARLF